MKSLGATVVKGHKGSGENLGKIISTICVWRGMSLRRCFSKDEEWLVKTAEQCHGLDVKNRILDFQQAMKL